MWAGSGSLHPSSSTFYRDPLRKVKSNKENPPQKPQLSWGEQTLDELSSHCSVAGLQVLKGCDSPGVRQHPEGV